MTDADRIANALERIADALESMAAEPKPEPRALPARRGRQRKQAPPRPGKGTVSDMSREKARRALERAGLR